MGALQATHNSKSPRILRPSRNPKGFKKVAGGRQAFEATSGISGNKKHTPPIGGGRQFALAAFKDELKTLLEKTK
jgi:hypothetical protein